MCTHCNQHNNTTLATVQHNKKHSQARQVHGQHLTEWGTSTNHLSKSSQATWEAMVSCPIALCCASYILHVLVNLFPSSHDWILCTWTLCVLQGQDWHVALGSAASNNHLLKNVQATYSSTIVSCSIGPCCSPPVNFYPSPVSSSILLSFNRVGQVLSNHQWHGSTMSKTKHQPAVERAVPPQLLPQLQLPLSWVLCARMH